MEHYKSIDRAVMLMEVYLERQEGYICSDHGFTDLKTALKNGWTHFNEVERKGGHSPNGVVISDLNVFTDNKFRKIYLGLSG